MLIERSFEVYGMPVFRVKAWQTCCSFMDILMVARALQTLMPRTNDPKNVAPYQDTEQFSGRPDVANVGDRSDHRKAVDPAEFAEATAHENSRNISQPDDSARGKANKSVKPDQPVTTSETRKTDEDVGGF
jgi:hypothetical protein